MPSAASQVGAAALATACCYKAAHAVVFVSAPQTSRNAQPSAESVPGLRGAAPATLVQSSALGSYPVSSVAAASALLGAGVLAKNAARSQRRVKTCRAATTTATPVEKPVEKPKSTLEKLEEKKKKEEEEREKERPPFDKTDQLGVTAPLGYFDPLGLAPDEEDNWRRFRAAEVKHGRVAMLACAGAIVQHWVRVPGFEDAEPGIFAAWKDPSIWATLVLIIAAGVVEALIFLEPTDKRRQPGDFEDPLGLGVFDEDTFNRELNNGRLAMFTSLGIIANELVTGNDAIEQMGIPF